MKLALTTFLAASIATSAATVRVNTSISLALAQARDGDTVLVPGPGVFHEHVVIAKSVRLLGTNSPVIDADHSGMPVVLAAPDAQVAGLTVRNSGRDLTAFDSGIMITGKRATVRDCRIENDAFGIYVHGGGDCVIEQNEICRKHKRRLIRARQRHPSLEHAAQPHSRQHHPRQAGRNVFFVRGRQFDRGKPRL